MDAFFAAIEQRDRPELRGKPVVVGSSPHKRGVVSTASYEARLYGIHSAMPSRTAYQCCPHAHFLPVNMAHYQEESQKLMKILQAFSPDVEPLSIDEAFLDVKGLITPNLSPQSLSAEIQQTIRDNLQLAASIGIAGNKFLAKLASGTNKPEGLTTVPHDPDEILNWLAPMDVSAMWGVGSATLKLLRAKGIFLVRDLQAQQKVHLQSWFGVSHGEHLWQIARGIDERPLMTDRELKSISNEHTFNRDCEDKEEIRKTLIRLTEEVGRRLRNTNLVATTVILKIRYAPFNTHTRQRRLPKPTNADKDLLTAGLSLFNRERQDKPVRLVGFGTSNLSITGEGKDLQGWLFDPANPQARKGDTKAHLDYAVDQIRKKYGRNSLQRGFRE